MVTPIVAPFLFVFAQQQQSNPSELEKAIQQDQALQAAAASGGAMTSAVVAV